MIDSLDQVKVSSTDQNAIDYLVQLLTDHGYRVCVDVGDPEAAAHTIQVSDGKTTVSVVIVSHPEDARTLGQYVASKSGIKVIVFEEAGSIGSAKLAINQGAFAYVERSDGPKELIAQVQRGFSASGAREVASAVEALPQHSECDESHFPVKLARLRSELSQVSNLAMLGEIIHGIAHEMNQPLAAISSFAGASSRVLSRANDNAQNTSIQHWLSEIGVQALRCGEIIHRLRERLKRSESERNRLDIEEVVEDSIQFFGTALGEAVKMSFEVAGTPAIVFGNRNQIQHVVVNLLTNAVESIYESNFEDPRVFIYSRVTGNLVRITIEDRGNGYDPETEDVLFDPFFSTKLHCIGLGLTASRSIIESHHGRLEVKRGHPRGAIFSFELPIFEGVR